jgi:predicted nucleotidyltransferase
MVLGYNQPRPTAENYQNFMTKLVGGLKRLGGDRLSLMVYGSYVRGDFMVGRSDIDSVLTFSHDVVIPKEFMHEISVVLYEALKGNNVPFQVCPLDVTTMSDGRFNSFTDDFYDYFQSEGRIFLGPDYRSTMVCLGTKTGEESALSYSLRKTRIALLFAEHDRQEAYEKFLERFNGTLNAASRGSKQVLYLVDGELRKNRFSALRELGKHFPAVNIEPLARIKDLYHHPEKLDSLYKNPYETMKVLNSAATFFEEVIREYVHKFPHQKNVKRA